MRTRYFDTFVTIGETMVHIYSWDNEVMIQRVDHTVTVRPRRRLWGFDTIEGVLKDIATNTSNYWEQYVKTNLF